MQLMLGQAESFEGRTALRKEISDYLISRLEELWMQELMAALEEVDKDDLKKSKMQEVQPKGVTQIDSAALVPAFAARAKEASEPEDDATLDEETFKALQWASKLKDYASLLSLMRSLPKEIVQEQVRLYRDKTCRSRSRGRSKKCASE